MALAAPGAGQHAVAKRTYPNLGQNLDYQVLVSVHALLQTTLWHLAKGLVVRTCPATDRTQEPPMKQFLCCLSPARLAMPTEGPTDTEARAIGEHVDFLQSLLARNVVLMAGRTTPWRWAVRPMD